MELIERYLEAGISFVGEECRETVASNPHNLAQSLLNLLGCMLDPAQGFDPSHPDVGTLLRLIFAWAFVWSVGANIDDASRPNLEKWVGEHFRGLVGSGSPFLKVNRLSEHLPYGADGREREVSLLAPRSEILAEVRSSLANGVSNLVQQWGGCMFTT